MDTTINQRYLILNKMYRVTTPVFMRLQPTTAVCDHIYISAYYYIIVILCQQYVNVKKESTPSVEKRAGMVLITN
jgi:hypothetical protein